MIKSKILKRISAGLMAMICAVTLFGTNLSGIDVHAAEAKEPLLTADEAQRFFSSDEERQLNITEEARLHNTTGKHRQHLWKKTLKTSNSTGIQGI